MRLFLHNVKMTTKGLAKGLEWISDLPCINSLAGLISAEL